MLSFQRRLLFLIYLFAILGSLPVNAVNSCRSIFSDVNLTAYPAVYSAAEFMPSHFGRHFNNQGLYPEWAAQSANSAIKGLAEGKSFEAILNELAAKRAQLALAQKTPTPLYFGRPRTNLSTTDLMNFDRTGEGPSVEKRALYKIVEKRLPRQKTEDTLAENREIFQATSNSYSFLNGVAILTSKLNHLIRTQKIEIHYTEDDDPVIITTPLKGQQVRVWIEHSDAKDLGLIMDDIEARMQNIRTDKKMSADERARQFVHCMYGYYNAMPFSRGSASIGKVIFSATYYNLFGEKLPFLPPDIDVLAMVLDQVAFNNLIRSYLP